MTITSRYYTTRELATLLNTPIATLRSWRYSGDGPPAIKIGHLVRYPIAKVDAWLAEREAAAAEEREHA